MKKLMIAFAAVLTAVAANAASISWNSGAVKDHTGTALGASTAYTATLSIFTYDGEKYTDVSSQWTGSLSSSTAMKSAYSATASNTTLPSGTYYAKLLIENADWSYTSDMTEFSFNKDAVAAQSVNLTTLGGMSSNTSATPNYGWVAAPEPTSGLLLLIGMAGLALRRRRA